ncbi:MAG: hypothetical protein R2932_24120 [Caldilineaceae bacterium]
MLAQPFGQGAIPVAPLEGGDGTIQSFACTHVEPAPLPWKVDGSRQADGKRRVAKTMERIVSEHAFFLQNHAARVKQIFFFHLRIL